MAFWIFALRRSAQGFRSYRKRDPWKAGLMLGVFAVIVCYLAGGLTEANLEHSKIRYTLALAFGILTLLYP